MRTRRFGRDQRVVTEFRKDLVAHWGRPEEITTATIEENFANGLITFDRFHVMKVLGEAVDAARRAEVATHP